jgi:hypothetical protein
MKKILFVLCLSMSGCAVVQDARTELRKEMVGFKNEWDRVILKKDVSYE